MIVVEPVTGKKTGQKAKCSIDWRGDVQINTSHLSQFFRQILLICVFLVRIIEFFVVFGGSNFSCCNSNDSMGENPEIWTSSSVALER